MYYAIKALKSQDKIQTSLGETHSMNKTENFPYLSQKKQKSTLLFVITQGAWGGAQRYVFDLAKAVGGDFRVVVAIGETTDKPSDLEEKLSEEAPEIEVLRLHHLKRRISLSEDIRALFELRRVYKQLNPSIIHLNSSKAGILGSFAQIFISKLRVIFTVHGWVFLEPLSSPVKWIYRVLEKFSARFKDAFIVLSEEEKNISLQLGIPSSKIFLIPLAIQPIHFLDTKTARRELASNQSQYWIGTIAGLYQTKGLDILVDAVNEIRDSLHSTHFFIIGDGPEEKNLRERIQSLHLEQTITLIGKKENAAQYLSAFDLFVLPSRKEGLPYTLLEALQAGLPIVATKVGGITTLLQNHPEAIVVMPEKKALAEAILRGLQKNTTGSFSSDVSFSKMLELTKSLYEKLMNSSKH